ncbi:MAG: MerR family DNA-binding protein [Armatimonadota bacterium]|nr:MerR family DNA-binding protein [Armatimonadota bacterium]
MRRIRERLWFVLRAKRAGLSLREVVEVFRLRDRGEPPCGHVRNWLDRKLAEVEDQLRALRRLREELRQLRHRAEDVDPRAPCICPIIEDAGADPVGSGARLFPPRVGLGRFAAGLTSSGFVCRKQRV